MNIFFLDLDTTKCAQYHVDKHVVKMILEYCQLMSTAHRVLDGEKEDIIQNGRKKTIYKLPDYKDEVLYTATHINHPSAIWVRESTANYAWLGCLLIDLLDEYMVRYGKEHSCERLLSALSCAPVNLPVGGFTKPPAAMPDEYKTDDIVESYRNYYRIGKANLHNWKVRETPNWI